MKTNLQRLSSWPTSLTRACSLALAVLALLLAILPARAVERQPLPGHLSGAVTRLRPVGRLASTNQIRLAIGLPLRNREALTNLLRELYDPTNPRFRRYLTPGQFTESFGPTAQDYQAAIAFAQANGLAVTGTHPNRMLLDVQGAVADVESAFHVKLQLYNHPKKGRTFYAPEAEPAIDSDFKVLHVSGLNNYNLPHPMDLQEVPRAQGRGARPRDGSGPNGEFTGNDFRTAYVPGTTLTGAGQVVGLFELNGYYASDITAYEAQTGLPNVPLQNVLVDGFNGSTGGRRPGSPNEEVALDIEMAISMAPGLSEVLVYEGSPDGTTATIDDILNRMATDNLAQQLSCSWGFDIDETTQQIFLQYAAQGQSFYLASGDNGAFSGAVFQPSDNPNITVVGGTTLTTDGAQGWVSETTWNGSSGGISTVYPIPDWQQGVDMSVNQGSTTMRNLPDVAFVADNVLVVADRGRSVTLVGTSIAAPLWAGFTALINERAAAQGKPPVGFVNPAIYRIGQGPDYNNDFHDITTGNNANSSSPSLFSAVVGYDLCTGWGTPNGTNLIEALLEGSSAGLLVTPPLGFAATGPVGGPFQAASATFTLTNAGTAPLNWNATASADWIDVTPSNGTLAPSGPGTVVTVSLNPNVSNLLIGAYTASVSFTDFGSGNSQDRRFSLSVGNGSFETGDLTDWDVSGQSDSNFADSIDWSQLYGSSNLPGVDDSEFVHSGIYGAYLGQTNSLGFLSQTLPTTAGQEYLLSFWLANPAAGIPNEFRTSWNGIVLFNQANLDRFAWTNLQYVVTASGTSTVLQFGFRNDPGALALDDITVQPIPVPQLRSPPSISDGVLTLAWTVLPQLKYQAQYTTDLNSSAWTDLGEPVTSPNASITVTDSIGSVPYRFYRIVVVP